MKWARIVGALVVLVGLASYFFYFDYYKAKKISEEKEEAKKVFKLGDKDKIVKLIIKRGEAPTIILVKEKDVWRIKSPIKTDADKWIVEGVLSQLKILTKQKKIPLSKEMNLATFGLKPPRLDIKFSLKDGRSFHIKIGDTNPTGLRVYAQKDDEKELFLISLSDKEQLGRDLFDLRDKELAKLRLADLTHFELKGPDRYYSLSLNKKEKWIWDQKKDFRLKQEKVEDLINEFTSLRAKVFVEEQDKDFAKYGLDKPLWTIRLVGKKREEKILLGKDVPNEKDKIYAHTSIRPGIVAVENSFLDKIPKDLTKLEDKTFVSYDEDDIQEIKWQKGETVCYLQKSGEKWGKIVCNKEKLKTRDWKVTLLLWDLSRTEYKDKIDGELFNKLEAWKGIKELSLTKKNNESIKIDARLLKRDKEKLVALRVSSNSSSAYYTIDKKDWEKIEKDIDQLGGEEAKTKNK